MAAVLAMVVVPAECGVPPVQVPKTMFIVRTPSWFRSRFRGRAANAGWKARYPNRRR
jgi:hypothetical protein